MIRRVVGVVAALAVAAGILLPGTSASAALPGTSNGGVRIMPLGDSITHGGATGGYRDDVQTLLPSTPIDWVGSETGYAPSAGDQDNEGHPGWSIAGRAPGEPATGPFRLQLAAEVGHWLFAADPRTVLLQAGTNDLLAGDAPQTAAADLAALIDAIVAYRPDVYLFVARIPQLYGPGMSAKVAQFNSSIPGIVAAKGGNVRLVEAFDDLVYPLDYFEEIHPDESGYDKMAVKWADALRGEPGALIPRAAAPAPPTGTISLTASNGLYVSAWQPDYNLLEPRSAVVAASERFTVVDLGGGWIALWSVGSQRYVTTVPTEQKAPLLATSTQIGQSEMFRWIQVAPGKVVLMSAKTSEFVYFFTETWGTFVYGDGELAYASSVFGFQAAP